MKRRLLTLMLTTCMVCGLGACGGSSAEKAATITIEGNTYDLSGDFQKVVGGMVENDLQVLNMHSTLFLPSSFDEDGKLVTDADIDKEEPFIYAVESCEILELDDAPGSFIRKVYWMDTNLEFQSKLGFDSDSSKKDIKELDGFMKTTPIRMMNSDTYVVLFVDGKAVDFTQYEEDFEDWKDMLDEEGYAKAYEEFFADGEYIKIVCRMFNADFLRMCNTYDELKQRTEGTGILIEEEVHLALAMQEACELLENGETENVMMVRVEVTEEDGILMEYNEFYFDEDWDMYKFKND